MSWCLGNLCDAGSYKLLRFQRMYITSGNAESESLDDLLVHDFGKNFAFALPRSRICRKLYDAMARVESVDKN